MLKKLALTPFSPALGFQAHVPRLDLNFSDAALKNSAGNALINMAVTSAFFRSSGNSFNKLDHSIEDGAAKLAAAKEALKTARRLNSIESTVVLQAENVVENLRHHLYSRAPLLEKMAYRNFYKSTFNIKAFGLIAGTIGLVWAASHLASAAKKDGEAAGTVWKIGKNTYDAGGNIALGAACAFGVNMLFRGKIRLPHVIASGIIAAGATILCSKQS